MKRRVELRMTQRELADKLGTGQAKRVTGWGIDSGGQGQA